MIEGRAGVWYNVRDSESVPCVDLPIGHRVSLICSKLIYQTFSIIVGFHKREERVRLCTETEPAGSG